MSVISAFKNLFHSTYNGGNSKRDLEILLTRYFPPDAYQAKVTPYRVLASLSNIGNSYQTCKNVDEAFKSTLIQFRDGDLWTTEFTDFRSELKKIYDVIASFDAFISLIALENIFGEARSFAGIFDLGLLIDLKANAKILSLKNDRGYIVPPIINRKQLEECISVAKGQAEHYGSVFPFHRLKELRKWTIIPIEQRTRFAQELFSGEEGYLELGNSDFFGFSNIRRDRIRTRLIKIYSVYDRVPTENLITTFQRTLKSKVNKEILEECCDVYDEYCLRAGYCSETESFQMIPTLKLRAFIKSKPLNDKRRMHTVERKLVYELRKNGAPMHTNSFMRLIKQYGANERYVMEFATLIYREGWEKNSTYHTLDDYYGENSEVVHESQSIDRKRIEVNRANRDNYKSRKVKRLCKNRCQICGKRIQIGEDKYYSEIHHIQPVGQPHFGPDDTENMLCVCPNHHVLLDYGVIPLEIPKLRMLEVHPVAALYIDYHNKNRFSQQT